MILIAAFILIACSSPATEPAEEPAEEPAPVEMDEVIESAPQVAELSSPAEEEEPPPSKVQRNRATREYLDFIENSAVKFGELMKLGLQKTRDYLSELQTIGGKLFRRWVKSLKPVWRLYGIP